MFDDRGQTSKCISLGYNPHIWRARRVPYPKGVGTNNLINEHLGRQRARLLLCSFLAFKVCDCEPSNIRETHILDADEFPTFFAQAVQGHFERLPLLVCCLLQSGLYESASLLYNRVFPSHHFNHHLLRLRYYSSSPKSSPS